MPPRMKNASNYIGLPPPPEIEPESRGEDENASENDSTSLHSKNTQESSDSSNDGASNDHTSATSEDIEEDTEPLQPLNFYFSPDKYSQTCKIQTRCKVGSMVKLLDKLLSVSEKKWFSNHPQFKHIWHMYKEPNHKVTGMWMLLLRTACTEKRKVYWFVVNGTPIRYSMREHALISGLNCRRFSKNYMSLGCLSFVDRLFGRRKNISPKDVEDKLLSMDSGDGDRLQIAVLFFLCTIIKGRKKEYGGFVDSFILQIVNDLDVCETFPWGRLTFEDCMDSILSMMENFNGNVKGSWAFPGFILPLELLAFECIPNLCKAFREDVREADESCPRMCRKRFKRSTMKGFPLEDINEKLGTTKDIRSCLEPDSDEEQALLLRLMDRVSENETDNPDPIADAWNKRVDFDGRKICWENLYNLDVAARGFLEQQEGQQEAEKKNQKKTKKREKMT